MKVTAKFNSQRKLLSLEEYSISKFLVECESKSTKTIKAPLKSKKSLNSEKTNRNHEILSARF